MAPPKNSTRSKQAGLTLIEVTLVITVTLMLVAVLFIGVQSYKKGSDRAQCIQQMASVQKAIRSYANLNAYDPGDSVASLKDQIIGPTSFVTTEPSCPAGGTYTFLGNQIPMTGTVYLDCSLPDHVPNSTSAW